MTRKDEKREGKTKGNDKGEREQKWRRWMERKKEEKWAERKGKRGREKEEGRGEEKQRLERGVEREVKNVYEGGRGRKVCTDVETSILFLVCYGL